MMKLTFTTLLVLGGNALTLGQQPCVAEAPMMTHTYTDGICKEYSSTVCFKANGTTEIKDVVHGRTVSD